VPAGVKITSAVFAHDITEAAWLLTHLSPGFETLARDVTDLDEDAYRRGRLETRLAGSLHAPVSPLVQGGKVATTMDTPLEGLVEHVLRDWDREAVTIIGAGSVCHAVKKAFWGEATLLGFDVVEADRIVATDCDAHGLERRVAAARAAGKDVHIVLSIIGGQGVLIGRGTQVLTPAVLRAAGWAHIHVVAPPEKLLGLRGLTVDSGDERLDRQAPKYLRVISGRNETRMCRINAPPKDSS
jgi:predicted polyphosphate/ATP-dependent NAD kinase